MNSFWPLRENSLNSYSTKRFRYPPSVGYQLPTNSREASTSILTGS